MMWVSSRAGVGVLGSLEPWVMTEFFAVKGKFRMFLGRQCCHSWGKELRVQEVPRVGGR